MKNQRRSNNVPNNSTMPNYSRRQIVVALMDCWEGYSTLSSYIGRFLQTLTFSEIQKNMNIAFKEEPGHEREFERTEKFILLCHLQIMMKKNDIN